MMLTFTCKCEESDGSHRRHECTAEDNQRKDVPGYFLFRCTECGWHAARCLLCDERHLCQWDITSSPSASKYGPKVYLVSFKSHCRTKHLAIQEECTHQQDEPNKRQRSDEYGEITISRVLAEEGTFSADHPDCDVTFDCDMSEKKKAKKQVTKERTTKRQKMN